MAQQQTLVDQYNSKIQPIIDQRNQLDGLVKSYDDFAYKYNNYDSYMQSKGYVYDILGYDSDGNFVNGWAKQEWREARTVDYLDENNNYSRGVQPAGWIKVGAPKEESKDYFLEQARAIDSQATALANDLTIKQRDLLGGEVTGTRTETRMEYGFITTWASGDSVDGYWGYYPVETQVPYTETVVGSLTPIKEQLDQLKTQHESLADQLVENKNVLVDSISRFNQLELQNAEIVQKDLDTFAAAAKLYEDEFGQAPTESQLTEFAKDGIDSIISNVSNAVANNQRETWARSQGYNNYQDFERAGNVSANDYYAKLDGWKDAADKIYATASGFYNPDDWTTHNYQQQTAKDQGFNDWSDLVAANATPANEWYASKEGWDNFAQKQESLNKGISNPYQWKSYLANSEGFDSWNDKVSAGATPANEYYAVLQGWKDYSEKTQAAEDGFLNPSSWKTYNDNLRTVADKHREVFGVDATEDEMAKYADGTAYPGKDVSGSNPRENVLDNVGRLDELKSLNERNKNLFGNYLSADELKQINEGPLKEYTDKQNTATFWNNLYKNETGQNMTPEQRQVYFDKSGDPGLEGIYRDDLAKFKRTQTQEPTDTALDVLGKDMVATTADEQARSLGWGSAAERDLAATQGIIDPGMWKASLEVSDDLSKYGNMTQVFDDGSSITIDGEGNVISYEEATDNRVPSGTTQVFDDGSSITTDEEGNVVSHTEETDSKLGEAAQAPGGQCSPGWEYDAETNTCVRVFDDGSSITTDQEGNIVDFQESTDTPYVPGPTRSRASVRTSGTPGGAGPGSRIPGLGALGMGMGMGMGFGTGLPQGDEPKAVPTTKPLISPLGISDEKSKETWVGGSGIKSDFINPLTFTAGASDDIFRLDPIQDVTRDKADATKPDTKGILTSMSEVEKEDEQEDEEGNDMDYYSYGNPTEPGDVLKPYSKYARGGTVMNSPLMAATGGVPHKGSHYVQGDGGGQDDLIDAKLADGEYVFDADIVAALGDGSNKRGAEILDKFRQQIRKHKRSASRKEIPPAAKSPLAYLKEVTS
jgi:hypothetical protein